MRQLRQGGLAKVGGFGQRLPNDSTWPVRTQSPAFHHEACKSLAMKCAQSRRRRCTEEAREDITSCVWCDHTSAETTHEQQAGNVPKGEAALWKGEIFLLVFIFQTFYSEQSASKTGPCIEGIPGSQPRAQHLLLYLTPNPLLSAASPRTQMSASPVTAESPASTHPGTQQTVKCVQGRKSDLPVSQPKELRPQSHLPKVTELVSGGLGTKVEELRLSREFLPPTQGVKVTPSQNRQ